MLSKENVQDIYALSPMQEGMLAQFARDPSSAAYTEQFDFHLEGQIDQAALQRSLDALVARHDALRTIFSFRKTDAPRQIVLKARQAPIRFEQCDPALADAALARFKQEDRARGFDLCADVLIRMALWTVGPGRARLVVSFHHIVLDGWCLGGVFGELFGNYERLCAQPGPLPPAPAPRPYRDYIAWVGAQDRRQAEAYWADYLQGYQASAGPAYSDLPHGAEAIHAEHRFTLGAALSSQLAQLAKTRHLTVNSLFQAAWGVLLQKYNNTDDVVFGAVVSGRPPDLPGVEEMVGLFINTQPLRVACRPDEGFAAVAARVQQRAVEAMAYDYHPLFAIQSASALKHRLLDHIVAFENYPLSDRMRELSAHSAALRIEQVQVFEQTSYDFNVIVCPGADIDIKFTYNAARYDAGTVAGMARSLALLLAQVCATPDAPVAQLSICADADRDRILHELNGGARDYPRERSLTALFAQCVAAWPDALAVCGAARSYTYAELHAAALACAADLRARGVQPGGAVALLTPRGPAMIVAILATLYCGAAYVPIDAGTPVDRVRFMLDDAGAALLCTVAAFRHLVPEGATVCYLDGEPSAAPRDGLPAPCGPEQVAYIMYTSGSTGQPKGCAVTHRNIVRLVRNSDFVDFGPDQRFLQIGAPAFDASTFELWGALLNGAQLHLIDEGAILDAALLRQALHDKRITAIFLTAALFNQHCETDPGMFAHLRYLLVGGEVLTARYIERARLANPGVNIINGYGPTENTTFSTWFLIDRPYDGAIPIGRPIAHSSAYILDGAGQLLPPGAIGELCVGGDGVARGYVNRPELTAEKFIADPFHPGATLYRTGDLARWLPDGNIGLVGRNDFQVKIRGFRIELGEIERALCAGAGVSEAVVIALDGPGGKQLRAFYAGEQDIGAQALRASLAARLPSYMVPPVYVRVERMPLTINGKVDRHALLLIDPGAQRAAAPMVEPKSVTERRIAEVCKEILGIGQIGVDDNFFDLGANSLNLITIANRLKVAFERDIALTALFEHTTIARLAEFLGADAAAADSKRLQEAEQLDEARSALLNTRNLMRTMEEQ
jgi:amino acid adenylation domain-containing protein